MISGPEFFLDLGKARLLVNSSPHSGGPADRARSMIGLKSFTFSVSTQGMGPSGEEAEGAPGKRRYDCFGEGLPADPVLRGGRALPGVAYGTFSSRNS